MAAGEVHQPGGAGSAGSAGGALGLEGDDAHSGESLESRESLESLAVVVFASGEGVAGGGDGVKEGDLAPQRTETILGGGK
ncbi:hypothetical protein SCUCBS95973_002638, partial [Sporothrix curviconia]